MFIYFRPHIFLIIHVVSKVYYPLNYYGKIANIGLDVRQIYVILHILLIIFSHKEHTLSIGEIFPLLFRIHHRDHHVVRENQSDSCQDYVLILC